MYSKFNRNLINLSNIHRKNISIYKPFTYPNIQKIKNARLITAIKTPYLENGKIDLDSFDFNANEQIKHGVEGFVIGGTTGEGHLFSWDEHIMLIAHAKHKFGDKCLIIGNTGSNSTIEANHATKQGFAVGMDASLQINPYYGKTSEKGVIKHFSSVLDHGPAIIYNVPGRTGQDISVEIMKEISHHENFTGVKECMGKDRIKQYTELDITTWSGNDDECHETRHKYGCNGVISVTSNILPGHFSMMMKEESPELAKDCEKLINYLFLQPNPIGINTVMMMLGLCEPVFRLPYIELDKNLRNEVKNIIEEIGIKNFISKNQECNVLNDRNFIHIE